MYKLVARVVFALSPIQSLEGVAREGAYRVCIKQRRLLYTIYKSGRSTARL